MVRKYYGIKEQWVIRELPLTRVNNTYVLCKGAGDNAVIPGLQDHTKYYFRLFEYNKIRVQETVYKYCDCAAESISTKIRRTLIIPDPATATQQLKR